MSSLQILGVQTRKHTIKNVSLVSDWSGLTHWAGEPRKWVRTEGSVTGVLCGTPGFKDVGSELRRWVHVRRDFPVIHTQMSLDEVTSGDRPEPEEKRAQPQGLKMTGVGGEGCPRR